MGKILIGWAEESMIPEKKVSLAGQFFERISEYVESDITVTAMAVEADGEQMIMVSADLGSFSHAKLEYAREKFARLTNEVDPEKIIVNATHTHTSFGASEPKTNAGIGFISAIGILNEFLPEGKQYTAKVTPDDSVMSLEEGLELATDKIALAAYNAWKNRKESLVANEFGRAAVGMCRRVSYDDGSAQMWGDTNTANFVALEGGNDSGIELLYTFDKDKKLTGVVANIACPAQILEQRSFISADFWGRTKAILREKFGDDVYLLGLCGAAGDQCPRDLVRWVDPETPIDDPNVKRPNLIERKADPSMYDISGCNRVGKRIANEIISVYEEISEYKSEAEFKHKVIALDLPFRKATMAEYNNAVRELEYYVAQNKDKEVFNFEDTARMHVYAGTISRYREQQNKEIHTIETHIIRLGDIAIATNPFELFLDYGNRIKARSYAKQTFIVQLCCGADGYLPTEKAEKAGHYSAYISSGKIGHEGGDLLTREAIKEINEMF
ncbi:MAG: hypothetical protein E7635_01930 [Ruminococcaceae bacterium]|nr:hypothetical protein [Oscillospiraceae bacterium]